MLPVMTSKAPRPGKWVRTTLPDGRAAMVTTANHPVRGRLVIVRIIEE